MSTLNTNNNTTVNSNSTDIANLPVIDPTDKHNFFHKVNNTNKPVYVINKETGEETSEIEMIDCDPLKDKNGQYIKDDNGQFITQKENWDGGYSDNIEIQINTTDKSLIPTTLSVEDMEELIHMKKGKLQVKRDENGQVLEYTLKGAIKACTNLVDDKLVNGFKALFTPPREVADYSSYNAGFSALAKMRKARLASNS